MSTSTTLESELAVPAFPATFRTQSVETSGATLHVRIGGQGPPVLLLHGFGDTGDMWTPLAAELASDRTLRRSGIVTLIGSGGGIGDRRD
jgi:hypothetical protein